MIAIMIEMDVLYTLYMSVSTRVSTSLVVATDFDFFVWRISSNSATGVTPCIRFAAPSVHGRLWFRIVFSSIDRACNLKN